MSPKRYLRWFLGYLLRDWTDTLESRARNKSSVSYDDSTLPDGPFYVR